MAKTIKFNLICDGYPARTLEDLQEHFSVEDILNYYHNGLLSRWLEVRGYTREKDLVEEIASEQSDLAIVKELIQIFDIESDESVIKRDTYVFSYRKRLQENSENLERAMRNRELFINEYYAEYESIIENILRNKSDMSIIKADLQKISDDYRILFDLDFRMLFKIFLYHAPKVLFAMLTNSYMRTKILQVNDLEPSSAKTKGCVVKRTDWLAHVLKDQGESIEEIAVGRFKMSCLDQNIPHAVETDRSWMSNRVVALTEPEILAEVLGDDLEVYASDTGGYTQHVYPTGQYLILRLTGNARVNAFNSTSRNLEAVNINTHFRILDGLDYLSQNNTDAVYFLRV